MRTETLLSQRGYSVLPAEKTRRVLGYAGFTKEQTCDEACAVRLAPKFDASLLVTTELATMSDPGRLATADVRLFTRDGLQLGSVQLHAQASTELLGQFDTLAPSLFLTVTQAGIESIPRPPSGADSTHPESGYELITIPGGPYTMGCLDGDPECQDSERPPRRVLVQPFALGRTEVLTAQYEKCADAGACPRSPIDAPQFEDPHRAALCNGPAKREDHPINCLQWDEANAFCAWIGARLPTPEEWEFAAKGGQDRIYPWGDERPDATRAQFLVENGTAPWNAHMAGASHHGMLDIAGNVWEWTGRRWGAAVADMEMRGGGWNGLFYHLRASSRSMRSADQPSELVGVRCAQSR